MDVRRPVGVALLGAQHVADGARHRHGIAAGLHRAEAETALRIRRELAAQVHVGLFLVLVLVHADRGGMPHVDLDAGERLALAVAHEAGRQQRRAGRRRAHDGAAVLRLRRVHAPEWPEQGCRRLGIALVAVVEKAHERRQADGIRAEHDLVVRVVGQLAEPRDIVDRLAPFLLRQLHLAREGVDVAHEAVHDLLEAGVLGPRHRLEHGVGHVFLAFDDHRRPSGCSAVFGRAVRCRQLGMQPAALSLAPRGVSGMRRHPHPEGHPRFSFLLRPRMARSASPGPCPARWGRAVEICNDPAGSRIIALARDFRERTRREEALEKAAVWVEGLRW